MNAAKGDAVNVTTTCLVRSQESDKFLDKTVEVQIEERSMSCVRETYTDDYEPHDELDTIGYTAPNWDEYNKFKYGV